MSLFRMFTDPTSWAWFIQPDPRGPHRSPWDLLDVRHTDCAECLRMEMEDET